MKDAEARALLRDLFDAALAVARPATCLIPYIDKLQPPNGRTIVIGAGKASAAMAKAVEDQWRHPIEGLVVTRYGYGEACRKIEIVEAAHPVPDEKGRAAAGRILERVKGHTPDDLVLCLTSGGASALLALPAPGLTLSDKQEVNRALLKSGANIVEMNTVRKHLSAIKGGRLAAACHPARVLTLAMVVTAWVPFRASSADQVLAMLGSMYINWNFSVSYPVNFFLITAMVTVYAALEPLLAASSHILVRPLAWAACLFLFLAFDERGAKFIYFQF